MLPADRPHRSQVVARRHQRGVERLRGYGRRTGTPPIDSTVPGVVALV